MTLLQFVPAALSLLLLGAHFLRSGALVYVALALVVAALLFVRRRWAGHVVQLVLLVGALEWVRTLTLLVAERRLEGLPYTRLAVILGAVAGFTLLSAALLQTRRAATYFARIPTRPTE